MTAGEEPRCANCAYWTEGASPLATAAPGGNPMAKPNVGTCSLYAPVVVETTWFAVSMFPEVHGDRVCSDWMTDFDPDDGAREEVPTDNVVKLERVA
jgi:hypothetical protein